jgi:hypothetical protein
LSDFVHPNESVGERLAPVRRLRASIIELMSLVAAAAVSFRWPGLTVPVCLLFLFALAQRRDSLGWPTRVALAQVALALYLPPAVGLFWVDLRVWDVYLERFSLMPTFVPAALIMGLDWVVQVVRFSPAGTARMVVLSLSPLVMIAGLGVVARRGIAWRIPCLIVALGMSAVSTFVLFVVMSIPT